jgi:soluble lytic murein transglycosylase-like protein
LQGACPPRDGDLPAEFPATLAARREIWGSNSAALHDIDPSFVYAIVNEESNFDSHARKGDANGLVWIKPRSRRAANRLPYESLVWNWRTNLAVGIEELSMVKKTVIEKGSSRTPMIWPSYH